jgi:hypothetical protein
MPKKQPDLRAVDNNEPIAPETVGDPGSIADLVIDQDHLEEFVSSGSEGEAATVECRRPPKGIFFTVRAEQGKPWKDRGFFWLLEMEGRDPLLVHPSIAKLKEADEDTIRPVLIVRYVGMNGVEALWPLKLDRPDARSNAYNASAMTILRLAEGSEENGKKKGGKEEGRWVRIVSGGQQKHYRYQVSRKQFDEMPPRFSDRSFMDLIGITFKDRIVTSLDHPIWEILKNGSNK